MSPRRKSREAQQAHREPFSLATEYAKMALAEPRVRARYERRAKKQPKRPWDVAMSDYFQRKDLLSKK